jgi:hypothetical protein
MIADTYKVPIYIYKKGQGDKDLLPVIQIEPQGEAVMSLPFCLYVNKFTKNPQ